MTTKQHHPAIFYVQKTLTILILAVYLVVVIFPFFWILSTSLKASQAEIYAYPIVYWPSDPSMQNYYNMLTYGNFGRYFLNSFICAASGAAGAVFLSIFASYCIARFKFRGRGAILFFFLFTQMIPMFIVLAPLYQMMAGFHLTNNLAGVSLLYMNGMIPFSVVTLRGFFQGVPNSIEEAAQIDGCSRLGSLFRVVLPVIKPGIATTFIFAFINSWNEVFTANMFLDDDALRTIPVALNSLILKYDIKWGEMTAGTMMAIIPSIILFAFIQKYMAVGLTAGAVKG